MMATTFVVVVCRRQVSDLLEWNALFNRAISKWFDLARVKGFARVDLACQLDAQVQISSNELRQSSSYIDVRQTRDERNLLISKCKSRPLYWR